MIGAAVVLYLWKSEVVKKIASTTRGWIYFSLMQKLRGNQNQARFPEEDSYWTGFTIWWITCTCWLFDQYGILLDMVWAKNATFTKRNNLLQMHSNGEYVGKCRLSVIPIIFYIKKTASHSCWSFIILPGHPIPVLVCSPGCRYKF